MLSSPHPLEVRYETLEAKWRQEWKVMLIYAMLISGLQI